MPKVIDLPTSTSMTDSDYFIMEQSSGGTKKITKQNAAPLERYLQRGISFAANTPTTITFSGGYRGILIINGTSLNVCGLYSVFNTGTGYASAFSMINISGSSLGSGITINNQTSNKIIITATENAYGILIGNYGAPPTIS